ncbi:phenylalanine--tRNA ligase subunit alpha [Candidatus Pacearchaeota archaeon]|nr:phenylalanine--tRNA ligase subunit alpha [Candidatus Pacearchaeota archaeon]|tara:strand:- start:1307 stop:2848 length:1542 start_codon:yes stop_codon:yes gene_type:complete
MVRKKDSVKNADMERLVESLSPNERKVIKYLGEGSLSGVVGKSGMDEVSVHRALEYLSNKGIVVVRSEVEGVVELGVNGVLYLKQGLPERRLMNLISEKRSVSLRDGKKITKLSDNEFKASLGVLKKKVLINLVNGNIIMVGKVEEFSKHSLEEKFIESLPKKVDDLSDEERFAFENLKNRRDIVEIVEKKSVKFEVTDLGRKIQKEKIDVDLVEGLTNNMLKNNSWKGKRFRRYDILTNVPKINGGKRHFVNQSIDYAKRIWTDLGFKEMDGRLVQSGFWNFDALFTAQDHPVREMQDTFFIDKIGKLPDGKIVEGVKKAHEGKIKGSKGWQSDWSEEEAKKTVLRTHTTCLSARTLMEIAKKKEFPAKYFALGKCFRNETVDWSHGFEFNQTEGIVVDENVNFRQLLGYLIEFFKKMGYDKIRIRPGYFPYTEPSLEIDVFHPVHNKWVELGGAGMFRPEVTIPIFGKHIPVLAWGPGFDRIIMEFFGITDLRDMYKNDLNKLRGIRVWDR